MSDYKSKYLEAKAEMEEWAKKNKLPFKSALDPAKPVADIAKTKDLTKDDLLAVRLKKEYFTSVKGKEPTEKEIRRMEIPKNYLHVLVNDEYLPLQDNEYRAFTFNTDAPRSQILCNDKILAYLSKRDKNSPSFQDAIDAALCEAESKAQEQKAKDADEKRKHPEDKDQEEEYRKKKKKKDKYKDHDFRKKQMVKQQKTAEQLQELSKKAPTIEKKMPNPAQKAASVFKKAAESIKPTIWERIKESLVEVKSHILSFGRR